MSDPVTRRAPGKLFITGEYAVMQPGSPAVLVAVDKAVSATVSTADGHEMLITSDLHPQPARLRWDGVRLVGSPGFAHVITALETVAELLAQHGRRAPTVNVSITSELHDGGTKFGLGSSGAVTVAVIDAALAHCGIDLDCESRYRLAMIATARLDPQASGADLAASTFGGWIEYRAPDRGAVLDLVDRRCLTEALHAPWPGAAVRRLPTPAGLALAVGWTGRPVSTAELIAEPGPWRGGPAHRSFLTAMADSAAAAIAAIEAGETPAVLAQVRTARRLLAELDRATGLGIFTAELTALCEVAEEFGGAAKPSGAGGGDCGIALFDTTDRPDIAGLRTRWAAAGVQHLPIGVFSDETDRT